MIGSNMCADGIVYPDEPYLKIGVKTNLVPEVNIIVGVVIEEGIARHKQLQILVR